MVFWSGFIKRIKSSVSQLTFDKLKRRVDNIESDYATKTYTDRQDAMLAQNITTNTNDIAQLRNEFDSKQYVNYRGNWNSTINYQTGDAITDNDLWYVSNVDNNLNHRPTGHSDTYWELISEPSIDLSNYYTKSQSDSLFAYKGDISNLQGQINNVNTNISNNYYTKTQCDQNFTSFATGLQLRSDVNANTTAINSQANILSRKADTSYVDDRVIIKYWAPFPSTTIGRGSGKQFRINGLPRNLNFINAQVQEGITENSDYLHSNIIWYIGDRELQIDTQYDYNSSACFVYVRNKSNYDVNIGGQYDAIGSLTLYFTRNVVRGGNITITA